ncbi:shikimate kinase [Arthrobacter sp. H5]|uniref:shikimate kinase n=1 Tax=Arthrobacter sp. H5 TaxID=1267973 RepID=UPI0004AE6AF1|nr:shikimate kinase [Arthrobacter sp. H5]
MPVAGNRPVVLIGMMGSGKSAVGRAYAAMKGLDFVDADQLIVDRHGAITEIFASRGEEYFRKIEAQVIAEAVGAADRTVVVSLGGGAVLHAATQRVLRNCCVVYLDADLQTVLPRIIGDAARPLLAGDPAVRWSGLHAERHALYERLADIILQTGGQSIGNLAEVLAQRLEITTTNNEGTTANGK